MDSINCGYDPKLRGTMHYVNKFKKLQKKRLSGRFGCRAESYDLGPKKNRANNGRSSSADRWYLPTLESRIHDRAKVRFDAVHKDFAIHTRVIRDY
jgi:hypothetical protein